ncbi:MAG: DUF4142 domain-containing protein [Phycisphaerales bacterium]
MWKYAAVATAAALVMAAGGCEDRTNRTTTTGRVGGETTTTRETTTTTEREGMLGTTTPQAGTPAAQPDTMFLREASSINKAEVELGKLALEHSQNPDVRAFAEMMAKHHDEADKRLREIADRIKVEYPGEIQPQHKVVSDRLKDLRGSEFDREFARAMVEGHQQAIQLFEREAQQGQNQDVKSYAQQTLPTLQQHLEHARELQKMVAGGVTGEEPGGTPPGEPPAQPSQPEPDPDPASPPASQPSLPG